MKYLITALMMFGFAQLTACGGASDSAGAPSNNSPIYYTESPNTNDPQGDKYDYVGTNPFISTAFDPLSTFGVDVDTASYDIFRRDLNYSGQLPRPDSVRVEEYINNFNYYYDSPELDSETPFAISLSTAPHILDRGTHILKVGIQAAQPPQNKRPANLVFLIDISGSMSGSLKLPLVKKVLNQTLEILEPDDTVSIVTYAGSTGVALEPTPVSDKATIVDKINSFQSGGSTAGAAGITLAYQQAEKEFIEGGINHIILCTDGDFNVGPYRNDALVELIEEKRKTGVTFTTLGFGTGNLNDSMMEATSNAGNGVYGVISSETNATDYVNNKMLSNLIYVAKDVKIQVEFNSTLVRSYRLIGYENRDIADEDFTNDKVDGGEIGAGHNVTALYEITLVDSVTPEVDDAPELIEGEEYEGPIEVASEDYALVKVRYKDVDATEDDPAYETRASISTVNQDLDSADGNLQWAIAISSFAEILKGSPYSDMSYLSQIGQIIEEQSSVDAYRGEFYELYQKALPLLDQQTE